MAQDFSTIPGRESLQQITLVATQFPRYATTPPLESDRLVIVLVLVDVHVCTYFPTYDMYVGKQ